MRGEALAAAVDALRAAGIEDARLDAELLLAEATGLDRTALIAHPEAPLEGPAARRFAEMVRRRLRREPVAYILGRRWFRRLELRCDRRALIPRPETETLVEIGLELGDGVGGPEGPVRLLDIGTGTGAIALAIADERPEWQVTATDTSPEALSLARENAERHGLAGRVSLIEGTLPPLAPARGPVVGPDRVERRHQTDPVLKTGPFDVVVANLPYVRDGEWPGLAPEIREFEPRSALTAGADGLDAIRAVATAIAARWPAELPCVAFEIGCDQAEATAALLREAAWRATETRRDLAGRDRVVIGRP